MRGIFIGAILAFAFPFGFAYSSSLSIGNGNQITSGYYLLLEKNSEGWKVDSIDQTPPRLIDASKQEILVFSRDLTMVEPYYSDYAQWFMKEYPSNSSFRNNLAKGIYECFRNDKGKRPTYNPCSSSLSVQTEKVAAIAADAIMGVATLGISLATGYTIEKFVIDPKKVQEALTEADAVNTVKNFNTKLDEQSAFARANSSSIALRNFIANFQNNDPAGLVPQAKSKLPQVESLEAARYQQSFDTASSRYDYENFINTYQSNDPDNLVPKAQEKLNELIAKQDAAENSAREELDQMLAQAKKQMLVQVKEIGQFVCTKINGTESWGLGRPEPRIYQISGYTEKSSGEKIQIRINGIQKFDQNGNLLGNVDRVNGVVIYQNGAIIWDDAVNWNTSCN